MLQALERLSLLSRLSVSSAPGDISPDESPTPATAVLTEGFTLFRNLPPECQLLIWEEATQNCFIKYVSVYYRENPNPPHYTEPVKSSVEVIALDKRAWMRLMLACKTSHEIAEKADRAKRDDSWELDSDAQPLFQLLGRAQGKFKYWDFWERSESIKSRRDVWREDFEMYVKCPHVKRKEMEEEEQVEGNGKRVLKIMNPDVMGDGRTEKARGLGGVRKRILGLLD